MYCVICKMNVSTRALRPTTIAKIPQFFKYGKEKIRLRTDCCNAFPQFCKYGMGAKFPGNESSMERKFLDFSIHGNVCSRERQFHGNKNSICGLFAPGNESAEERKVQIPFIPRGLSRYTSHNAGRLAGLWTFRSSALSFPEAKSLQMELSIPGTFAPWNFSSSGTFVPRERTFQELSLTGIFVPVELSLLRSECSKNFHSLAFLFRTGTFVSSERIGYSKNFCSKHQKKSKTNYTPRSSLCALITFVR